MYKPFLAVPAILRPVRDSWLTHSPTRGAAASLMDGRGCWLWISHSWQISLVISDGVSCTTNIAGSDGTAWVSCLVSAGPDLAAQGQKIRCFLPVGTHLGPAPASSDFNTPPIVISAGGRAHRHFWR